MTRTSSLWPWLAVLLLAMAGPSNAAPQAEQKGHPEQEGDEAPAQGEDKPRVERVILRERNPLFMELSLASPDPMTPMLVLCHQARSSKGEYRPIVPRLRQLGYNCLAVDLSAGRECREIKNMTARRASGQPNYLDAMNDMRDAVLWAREHHAHGRLVLFGSSFSAGLAFPLAAEHPDLIDGIVAFSPGEYFTALGKSPTWVQDSAKEVYWPVFISSPAEQVGEWKAIFEALSAESKTRFVQTSPVSGSPALWPESEGSEACWKALEPFLAAHFPLPVPRPTEEK